MQCLLEGKKNKIILEAMHFGGGGSGTSFANQKNRK